MRDDLSHLEFVPEPQDSRILSAVDPEITGHQDRFRAVATGWDPQNPPQIRIYSNKDFPKFGIYTLVVVVILIFGNTLWNSFFELDDLSYPDSEWAYLNSGIRDLADLGFDGSGIRVCMVDTGIDLSHPDLEHLNIIFKDFVESSTIPLDRGINYHGTMMAGILAANGNIIGAAPGVQLSVAAALGGVGTNDSGLETTVAQAIEWCWKQQNADVISLSLGGEQDQNTTRMSDTESAVQLALANGAYVVAAAGNNGGTEDDNLVSSPSNVPLVIAVGAIDEDRFLWKHSTSGSAIDLSLYDHPNLKPEIVAPGTGIISTVPNGPYYMSSGTSGATVFVTGALTLILEKYPELKSADSACMPLVKQSLMESAKSNPNYIEVDGHNFSYGYGSLDALEWSKAIAANLPC